MRLHRRALLIASASALAACAVKPAMNEYPPIVFVHGNGDNAALWMTTIWRFESSGWPRDRLHAIDVPYPLARDDDTKPEPGRSGTAEHMAFLKSEVDKVMKATGAAKVVLIGNSRGGNAIRNYIQNGGGGGTVSHAILGGTPNHGIWATKGFREANEFSGTGPFLTTLNAPKNAAGDEVTGPVKWMTVRSDNNDKYAQPDGLWIGAKGTPTNVGYDGPALKGAVNIVLPRADHRETSFSPAAFEAAYSFITGRASKSLEIVPEPQLVLNGKISGLGLDPQDPKSGSFANNLALAGAAVTVFAVDAGTGERKGAAVHARTTSADGMWGPFSAQPGVSYEFVIAAPGYATSHIYRSPFARSSQVVHLRAERIAEPDKAAGAIVTLTRPRGYLDPGRDRMAFDGATTLQGVLPGAGVSSSKLRLPAAASRPVEGLFNGEKLTGRTWPAADGHTSTLELTY
ncbi:MAG: twin-arginine translocation pathway signal [Burkholderiales bacterium]|nr:MAG: twin-arginine translocation pathway signal [Burkholderiales bacterium]